MVDLAEKNDLQLVVSGYYIDTYYSDTEKFTQEQVYKDKIYKTQAEFRADAHNLLTAIFSTLRGISSSRAII